MAVKCTVYQCKVDVDMLNAVKSVLADISSVSPSSEQREGSILTVVHRPQASKNTNGPLSVSVASPGGQ